jgi:hypothetical protein
MILADILQWFLIVVGVLLTLNAHWIGAHALFPGLVARARDQIEHRPFRATGVGLLVAVPVLLGVTALAKSVPHPLVQTLSVGLALLLGLLALTGSAGLAQRIGVGLPSPIDALQPWRCVLRGGIVMGLAFLMPFLGWFVLLPWTLVSGLGAVVLAGRAPRPYAGGIGLASVGTGAAGSEGAPTT